MLCNLKTENFTSAAKAEINVYSFTHLNMKIKSKFFFFSLLSRMILGLRLKTILFLVFFKI